MPARCPWQHGYDQVVPDCWDPTRARSINERMFSQLSYALLGCGTRVIFRVLSRRHNPRFHFFFEKKHTELFADLFHRGLESLVEVTMDFSRGLDSVDRGHDQHPLTYVPNSFLGWDSYYTSTSRGIPIPYFFCHAFVGFLWPVFIYLGWLLIFICRQESSTGHSWASPLCAS